MDVESIEKIYVDEKAVSEIMGCSVQTLRNNRHLGRGLAYVKHGKSVRYYLPDVYAKMEGSKIRHDD